MDIGEIANGAGHALGGRSTSATVELDVARVTGIKRSEGAHYLRGDRSLLETYALMGLPTDRKGDYRQVERVTPKEMLSFASRAQSAYPVTKANFPTASDKPVYGPAPVLTDAYTGNGCC